VEGPSGAGDAPSPPAGGQVGGYADLAALPPKTLAEADAFVESMGYDLSAFYERPTEEDFESLSTNGLADKRLSYAGYDLFGAAIGDCADNYTKVHGIDYDYRVNIMLTWNSHAGKAVGVEISAGIPSSAFTVTRSTNAESWPYDVVAPGDVVLSNGETTGRTMKYIDQLPTYDFVKNLDELRVWIQFYGGAS
jgi:hypothetical protein